MKEQKAKKILVQIANWINSLPKVTTIVETPKKEQRNIPNNLNSKLDLKPMLALVRTTRKCQNPNFGWSSLPRFIIIAHWR